VEASSSSVRPQEGADPAGQVRSSLPAATAPLEFSSEASGRRLTHHLFRFPAKFHAPVAAHLIRDYTVEGETILDPFCGSGTLLVESAVNSRNSVGLDVDPLSVFVSRTKSKAVDDGALTARGAALLSDLEAVRRSDTFYQEAMWGDLSDSEWNREASGLPIPEIPKLLHWFRRYVAIDLARILQRVGGEKDPAIRNFFRLVFASCIRNASNADPVPVSGLEVTRHMRELEEKGREINPFLIFERRLRRALLDMREFAEQRSPDVQVRCRRADVARCIPNVGQIDAVITSPPYHGAVDYYRRHQLEQFWLGLVSDHNDRLSLLEHYLGRPKVPAKHPFVRRQHDLPTWAAELEKTIKDQDPERARAFRHYCVGMSRSLKLLAQKVKRGGRVVFVVGHSRWKESTIDTSHLFSELSQGHLRLLERRSYPVVNRYMSYKRHNGASIDEEFVLVYESIID
jgi:DNA methylase